MRKRRRIQKQLFSSRSEPRCQALRKKLITIEKELQQSLNSQRERDEKNAVDRISTNCKYFYSYAKRFSSIKSGIGPLLDAAEVLISCPKKMGEILAEQYSSQFELK